MSVAELAKASGKNEKSIRRAITSGRLPAEKDESTGQYRIARAAGYKLYPPVHPTPDEPEQDGEIEQVEINGELRALDPRELRGVLASALRIGRLEQLSTEDRLAAVLAILDGWGL